MAPTTARAPAARPTAAPAAGLLQALPGPLRPLAQPLVSAVQQQAGYRLLTQAVGHDPLTGQAVPAAPQALAHTLLGLLPDGEARYQQLQAAGPALAQLPAWLGQQLAAHQLSGARLSQVLAETWATVKALGWRDLLDLPAALARLARPWLALARDLARFVVQAEGALLRFLVRAVLGEAQAAPVLRALDRGGELLLRILRHPLPFLQNLVAAGWRGFQNFLKNGPRHLLASVQDWLLGGLAKAGLHLPARLDVAGVIDLLLQVFHLTKTALLGRLRQRLAAVIGPENLGRLEEVIAQVGGVARTLWQHGPAAAWQAISQQAGDLKAQALDFVQQQVLGLAARAVPVFLATLAVPGGAFVQVARGLYNGVMTFVEKGRQIAQVGAALLDSAAAIAAGQLAPAALAVETTLVKVLPVALSFLARWLGLGGISEAIQNGLKKVQAPLEKAVNKVLDVITDKARALWGAAKGGAGKAVDKGRQVATAVGNKVAGWLGLRQRFVAGTEQHTLFFDEGGQLMLASDPHPYETLFTDDPLVRKLPVAVLRAEQTKIRPTLAHIQQLSRLRRKLDNQQQLFMQKKPGAVDLTTPLQDNRTALEKALQVLSAQTISLLQVAHAAAGGMPMGEKTPEKPAYAGLTPHAGFGKGMQMEYVATGLDPQKPKELKSIGSEANGPNNPVFNELKKRGKGDGSYYVQGHLLNRQMHGPGDTWENLTPLSQQGNTNHKNQVENTLRLAAQNPGRAFFYSVVPQYGRALRHDLLAQLKPQLTGDPNNPADRTAAIIRAEQFVPLFLLCRVREAKQQDATTLPGRRGTNNIRLEQVVDNPVEQDNLTIYKLLGTTAIVVNALDFRRKFDVLGFSKKTTELIATRILKAGTSFSNLSQLTTFIKNQPAAVLDAAQKAADIDHAEQLYKADKIGFGQLQR